MAQLVRSHAFVQILPGSKHDVCNITRSGIFCRIRICRIFLDLVTIATGTGDSDSRSKINVPIPHHAIHHQKQNFEENLNIPLPWLRESYSAHCGISGERPECGKYDMSQIPNILYITRSAISRRI